MIAATFHGPNYESLVNDESSIEVFSSLGHAMSALFDRYDSNGTRKLDVNYLNGFSDSTYFPCVTLGHYFDCYVIPDDFAAKPGDEGIMLEALTAVHTGVADYRLTLAEPFGEDREGMTARGTVAISVQRGA